VHVPSHQSQSSVIGRRRRSPQRFQLTSHTWRGPRAPTSPLQDTGSPPVSACAVCHDGVMGSGTGTVASTQQKRWGPAVATYLDWNDALASRFFRPEAVGKPVYLQVTDEVLAAVGSEIQAAPPDFVAAILRGPEWVTRDSLCQRALQAMRGWRARGAEFPPYVAYLAAFVLAAGLDGEYAAHAYYPRLHDLLGTPSEHMPPSFDRIWELWLDLEAWSMRDRHGELGLFTARSVGGFIHVGYPLSQAILTEHEWDVLERRRRR
jgi:hypothetical protein